MRPRPLARNPDSAVLRRGGIGSGRMVIRKLFRARSPLLGSLLLTITEIPLERRAIQKLPAFSGRSINSRSSRLPPTLAFEVPRGAGLALGLWLPKTPSELKTQRFRSFVRSWCYHDELSFRRPFRFGRLEFSNPCRPAGGDPRASPVQGSLDQSLEEGVSAFRQGFRQSQQCRNCLCSGPARTPARV